MRNHHAVLMFLAALALAVPACSDRSDPTTARSEVDVSQIRELSIDELDAALAAGECTAVDANRRPVRVRNGTIPGAILLSHYRDYDLDELPRDKTRALVFYCANEQCKASDAAAERALVAGYTDVRVLRAGIHGWGKAGKKTEAAE